MSTTVQFDSNATCDRCGRFGVYVFEGQKLCAECYELRGSCCAEFGGDDLTERERPAAESQIADEGTLEPQKPEKTPRP